MFVLPVYCELCGSAVVFLFVLNYNLKMNTNYPINDVVCNLLQTRFSQWKDDDQKDLLEYGRPTISLIVDVRKEVKQRGKSYNIKFKNSWFSDYMWLCSSVNLQKLFCWPCLLFSTKFNTWNKDGFCNYLMTSLTSLPL